MTCLTLTYHGFALNIVLLLTYWAAGPRYREFKELPKVCLYSCSLVWFGLVCLVRFGFALVLVWFWLGLVWLGWVGVGLGWGGLV